MITLGIIKIKLEIFLLLSFIIVLAVQFLLCYKVKSRIIRLTPVGIFTVLTAVLYFLAVFYSNTPDWDWDGLAYTALSIYTFILLFGCVTAWIIWIIWKASTKIKSRK